MAPARKPVTILENPPSWNDSSISSNEIAEINTPAPNAIIEATIRSGILNEYANNAPIKRADPAIKPHNPAIIHSGIIIPLLLLNYGFNGLIYFSLN